ncbi:hypothetical protein HK19_01990 [Acetobacter persici]|uniref:Uncharacterized protein n=1 Tax=Acetobacter malorum TaxID=178901 RepID=A0A149V1M6_9PROT|nr:MULTISPECIES: hypothetical protein [Acetobacter]KXV74045.1 hypothetical protein AD951_00705 [Acetobacter malorum]MBS1017314.1 hypothetical protein [Acetobacter persici]OUI86833.1 hypothetical protein HK19_01990 [Acetobacter persici]
MKDESVNFAVFMTTAAVFGVGIGVIWALSGFAALLLIPLCMFPVKTTNSSWTKSFTIDLPNLFKRPTDRNAFLEWNRQRRLLGLVLVIAFLTRVLIHLI